ncbi:hypothetical protein JEZ23_21065 [Pseudomonas aeruginosa]|nr:hypothetical protein [Pseudomonas aeruginosa]HCF3403498.1 hypothetical protein [Pseudomonas aeruginosa]HCF5744500.1 hypothetical protein [Pseudomonas aeruginosa]
MTDQAVSAIRFTLFKHSRDSFLAALDAAFIPHSSVVQFSGRPQASGFTEMVSALSDALPWNGIAKVIISWVEARKSRRVMINMKDGVVSIEAEGYGAKDVERLLRACRDVTIIDTLPQDEEAEALDSDVVVRRAD